MNIEVVFLLSIVYYEYIGNLIKSNILMLLLLRVSALQYAISVQFALCIF